MKMNKWRLLKEERRNKKKWRDEKMRDYLQQYIVVVIFYETAFIKKEWIQGLTKRRRRRRRRRRRKRQALKRKGNQLCIIVPTKTKDLWSACWWATPFGVWGRLYGWLLSLHFSGIFGVNKIVTFQKCFLFFWLFYGYSSFHYVLVV